jgi:LSD1 subclass zinc finger protein
VGTLLAYDDDVELKPLVCSACDAAVPLGTTDTTTCPYCGARVAVPPELVQLRDADKQQRAARAEAAELLTELAQPLPIFVRAFDLLGTIAMWTAIAIAAAGFIAGIIVAFASDGADSPLLALVFGVFIGLLAVPQAWEYLLHRLAPSMHVDLVDRLGGFWASALLGAVIAIVFVLPIVFGTRARTLRELHDRLQRQFAGKPPLRPGGPARCRHCDAPLEVAPGALGVRCLYCNTDNLIEVTASAAAQAGTAATISEQEVSSARVARGSLLEAAIGGLKLVGLLALVLLPMCGGVGRICEALIDLNDADGTPHSTRASGPVVLHGDDAPHAAGPGDVALSCTDCTVYVPLHRGDALAATGSHAEKVDVERRVPGPWYGLQWDWGPMNGPAQYTGWYRIHVVADGDNKATLQWSARTAR